MGEPAIPLFLGAGENAVTKTKCAPFSALNNTQARRWLALSFPAIGNGDDVLPVHIDDAQNRHFRHAAHFVKGPPRRTVEPALVRHILAQRLPSNFLRAGYTEGAGVFPFARGPTRRCAEPIHWIQRG